ncbi:MAG: hypothetical protein H6640_07095 [Caldilineaceae bacterium]|nr:hypothetical protein [Caldilineaceae bacterium]
MNRERRFTPLPWLLLPLLAVPAFWPLADNGLTASFDGATHLLRLGALQRAVSEGVILPRWLPDMQLGYGYPVFNFYPAGAYFVALLPTFFGATPYWAYALGFVFAIVLAGFGAMLLARDLLRVASPWPALVAGVAYMYAPYLLVNVYIRGSLPEALAQALLPWVLWSARRVLTRPRPTGYVVVVALTLGGLALTHSLTLMLFVPYLAVYVAVIWWTNGHARPSLHWIFGALLAAMGISAFFWLPMLFDRQFLSDAAFATARFGWLPDNVWHWDNFLDPNFLYGYDFMRPVQLGLLQMLLAGAGFFVARRFDAEWLFFAISALGALGFIGAWSLPIWQSNEVLTVVQFPWRLLSVASLSLAMLTAGLALPVKRQPANWLIAAALIVLIVIAQRPRLAEIETFSDATVRVDAPMLAQAEVAKGVLTSDAASSVEEFRPRWAAGDLALEQQPQMADAGSLYLANLHVNPLELAVLVSTPATATLRFQDFYFPGWRIVTSTGQSLRPYPSTALGLLTVDLPPGTYVIDKLWRDPPLARLGSIISLVTLAALAAVSFVDRRFRWMSFVAAMILTGALVTWLQKPPLEAVHMPKSTVDAFGLRFLGYRAERVGPGSVLLYPYWYVNAPPPSDLRFRWQVLDERDNVVQEYVRRPFFNAQDTANWPVGTIVDDAQQITLPESFDAGRYRIALGLEVGEAGSQATRPVPVGRLTARRAARVPVQPDVALDARFGDEIRLIGADYAVNGAWLGQGAGLPRLAPGDEVTVMLYWQAEESLEQNLHGFVHLVDGDGAVIAQQDQVPGPDFQPTTLWLPNNTVRDEYRLRVPEGITSRVVWPLAGLYDPVSVERLPVTADPDEAADGAVRLPPLKIAGDQPAEPFQAVDVRFGDLARLSGVAVHTSAVEVSAGDTLTVTLRYDVLAPTDADLTRFVHLYDPAQGMAAQADGIPQQGLNPTWAWLPGEQVGDQVVLTVASDAPPGRYRLVTGFYDAMRGGERVGVFGADGASLPDNLAPLMEIEIHARE